MARQPAQNDRLHHPLAKIIGKRHPRRLLAAARIMNQNSTDSGIPVDSVRSDTALTPINDGAIRETAGSGHSTRYSRSCWLPFLNAYRTMCLAPVPDFRRILEEIPGLQMSA